MKQIVKKVIYHFNCIVKTISWGINVVRIENFKNYLQPQHEKDSLLILANGPSLKNVIAAPIPDLQNSEVCVVNDFARFPVFTQIKPNHYVLADPFYFEDLENQRNAELHEAFFKVDWRMNLYIPYSVRRIIKGKINNPNITIIPYHCIPYDGWKKLRYKLYDFNLSMPRPQNVVIPSIFIAIKKGFKRIGLYGVDHSWTEEIRVNQKNEVCYLYHHFFDKKIPDLKPWYRGTGKTVYKMHEILRDLAWMFDGYHKLREYADRKGCKIINHTPDSFIDAFERENNSDTSLDD